MRSLDILREELHGLADPIQAEKTERFFKTGSGEYAEKDAFMGLTMPQIRKLARRHGKSLNLEDVEELLQGHWHDERALALVWMVDAFSRGAESMKESIYKLYVKHLDLVNNWDLVDLSAPTISGGYLQKRDRSPIFAWASSPSLWHRRVAILTTSPWIKEGDFGDFLRILDILQGDSEDLIRKALGWMLREVGKVDRDVLLSELEKRAAKLAPVTLSYAMEHLDGETKKRIRAFRKG